MNTRTPIDGTIRVVAALESTRRGFLDTLARVDATRWDVRPEPAIWSIRECAEHVVLTEAWIVNDIVPSFDTANGRFSSPEETGKWADDAALYDHVTTRNLRITTPEPLRPTGRYSSFDSVAREFRALREKMVKAATGLTTPTHRRITHCALGPLDLHQWLVFGAAHADLHSAQIADIAARLEAIVSMEKADRR